ncbi:helix-turn-helix transcriptional regulator [Tenacibaculum dicentrarchi]|uniref:helix-turn-helix transcriptional regulator n=1 Tax=Tenacibaculum dicentrarchi TaxID=669041 RepID=UPI00351770D4
MKSNSKKYNRIKIVLVEQERSSKWLAEKIDKDKSTVSRWCTNDMQPSVETLFQISEILGVSVKELLNEKANA